MSIVIAVEDEATLLKGIEALGGQLTATIIGDENELSKAGELLDLLTRKAGRILFNGFPTGWRYRMLWYMVVLSCNQ